MESVIRFAANAGHAAVKSAQGILPARQNAAGRRLVSSLRAGGNLSSMMLLAHKDNRRINPATSSELPIFRDDPSDLICDYSSDWLIGRPFSVEEKKLFIDCFHHCLNTRKIKIAFPKR